MRSPRMHTACRGAFTAGLLSECGMKSYERGVIPFAFPPAEQPARRTRMQHHAHAPPYTWDACHGQYAPIAAPVKYAA